MALGGIGGTVTWLRDASAGDPIGNLPLSTAQYSSARAEGIDKLTNQHTREEHDEGLRGGSGNLHSGLSGVSA